MIARVVFSVQQWSQVGERHPIAIFCDEAHLYIPAYTEKSIDDASLVTFERISKEGRKYGVGLVVISQRPSRSKSNGVESEQQLYCNAFDQC